MSNVGLWRARQFVEIGDRGGPWDIENSRKEASGWHRAAEPALPPAPGRTGPRKKQGCHHGSAQLPSAGERKDMEQRQEFRQLILYLKNNKQPDFTY